eukprot:771112_1
MSSLQSSGVQGAVQMTGQPLQNIQPGQIQYPQNVVQAQPVYQPQLVPPAPMAQQYAQYRPTYVPPVLPAPVRPPARDISQIKCYNCDRMGHYATTCQDPPRAKRGRYQAPVPVLSPEEVSRNADNARMAELYRKHQAEEQVRVQCEAMAEEKRQKIQREEAFFSGIDQKFDRIVSVFHSAGANQQNQQQQQPANIIQNIPKVKVPEPIAPLLKVSPSSDTAVRDLFVGWLELQVAGGVESVRAQILAKKFAKSDLHVMRLYKWLEKMGAQLEESKKLNAHQAVENLAIFFTE